MRWGYCEPVPGRTRFLRGCWRLAAWLCSSQRDGWISLRGACSDRGSRDSVSWVPEKNVTQGASSARDFGINAGLKWPVLLCAHSKGEKA